MKKYLVGGAVRDLILKRKSKDFDYVILNTNEKELLNLGYRKISNNFPVFEHDSYKNCQFSLPRKEIKTGKGYSGFTVLTENVSLYEDLKRRDFTINAMALDENKNIIDYFSGLDDLKNKTLRHIGNHFSEDPLRIIRACRFQARYNFNIHNSTIDLIREMNKKNMLLEIPASRFVQEFKSVEKDKKIKEFFNSLFNLNIFEILFPNVDLSLVSKQLKYIDNSLNIIENLLIILYGQNQKVFINSLLYKGLSKKEQNIILYFIKYSKDIIEYNKKSIDDKVLFFNCPISLKIKRKKIFTIFLNRLNQYEFLLIYIQVLRIIGFSINDKQILKDWGRLEKTDLSSLTNSKSPYEDKFNLLKNQLQS